MLRDKTKGNLTDDERKLLDAVLGDLQANYAETVFSGSGGEESSQPDAREDGDAQKAAKEGGSEDSQSETDGEKIDQE
jgi:hypothetical protein